MAKTKAAANNDGKIELKQVATGITDFFEHNHAERILNYDIKHAGGAKNWELVDPKLTFENGKIAAGQGKGTDSDSEK